MLPRVQAIGCHVARLAVASSALALAAHVRNESFEVVAAAALFFETFAATHDLAHGALRLPRRVNEIALGVVGVLGLNSGHVMRRMHLEHHRKNLGPGDVEGTPANWSFAHALVGGPAQALALRIEAFRGAGRVGRMIQTAEHAATIALFAFCLGSRVEALAAYALVALALHSTAALWAAHVPHRAPAWLLSLARTFAFSRSPTVLALAYHDLHHQRPDLPVQDLGQTC